MKNIQIAQLYKINSPSTVWSLYENLAYKTIGIKNMYVKYEINKLGDQRCFCKKVICHIFNMHKIKATSPEDS